MERHVGLQARLNSQALRKLSGSINQNKRLSQSLSTRLVKK